MTRRSEVPVRDRPSREPVVPVPSVPSVPAVHVGEGAVGAGGGHPTGKGSGARVVPLRPQAGTARGRPPDNLGVVPTPPLADLLHAAVAGIGGTERPGQVTMAAGGRPRRRGRRAPAGAGRHRHRQVAGLPGAGAAARGRTRRPVVVSTATLALQAQVVDRDLPRLADALAPLLGRRPTYALVKGRRNYLCRHKLVGGVPGGRGRRAVRRPGRGRLGAAGRLGERGRAAARRGPTRPRPATATSWCPGVSERAWRQVSVLGPRVPGRNVPVARSASPRRPAAGPRSRRRGDQPRAARHRRLRGPPDPARARPGRSSTRATSWSTGSPRRSPTS